MTDDCTELGLTRLRRAEGRLRGFLKELKSTACRDPAVRVEVWRALGQAEEAMEELKACTPVREYRANRNIRDSRPWAR